METETFKEMIRSAVRNIGTPMVTLVREKGAERVAVDPTECRTAQGCLGDTVALEKLLDLHRERKIHVRIRKYCEGSTPKISFKLSKCHIPLQ